MQGKTVLIVDDDLSFSEMLSEILHDAGARVLVEHDGLTGLNQALSSKPDLILLDVMMPRMSGLAVLEKLRADAWGATVPALLLTNMNEPGAGRAGDAHTTYLLKTDHTLDGIAKMAGELLAQG